MSTELDRIIARLQSMAPFNVYQVMPNGDVQPWYEVKAEELLPELIVRTTNVLEQAQTVTGQIAYWGRMAAQSKRVWEILERRYRVWKAQFLLDAQAIPAGEKKPTQAIIDAKMRVDPAYTDWYVQQERAEEAFNSAEAILSAWRGKKNVMKDLIIRTREDSAGELRIN